MRSEKRKDSLENKETLDFLINITELLKASNAIIGRNDEMFALDASKVPQLLADKNEDLSNLFMERKLIVDQENLFSVISIVTTTLMENEILFFDIADSISPLNHKNYESYPLLNEVRNWFLSIPRFSEKDRDKYEKIYQAAKKEMNKIMHKHANEVFKAIFSGISSSYDTCKKKLH